MASVRYSPRALADLNRLVDFLRGHDPTAARAAAEAIVDAVKVLVRHPFIGRPVAGTVRELVISRGATGYVALYRFRATDDVVDVLALRHPREAGYG